MTAVAFDLCGENDLEHFLRVTDGLFTDDEYLFIHSRVCSLWELDDQWTDILNTLTSQQKYNLEELVGTPMGWPFTPIIALDEDRHAKAIMMLILSDCGINVNETGRGLNLKNYTVINLTKYGRIKSTI